MADKTTTTTITGTRDDKELPRRLKIILILQVPVLSVPSPFTKGARIKICHQKSILTYFDLQPSRECGRTELEPRVPMVFLRYNYILPFEILL